MEKEGRRKKEEGEKTEVTEMTEMARMTALHLVQPWQPEKDRVRWTKDKTRSIETEKAIRATRTTGKIKQPEKRQKGQKWNGDVVLAASTTT